MLFRNPAVRLWITWILIWNWAFALLWKFIKSLPSIRTDWWSMHTKYEFILNIRYEKPDCNFQLLILLHRSNQKHVLYWIFPIISGIKSIMFLYIEWKKLKNKQRRNKIPLNIVSLSFLYRRQYSQIKCTFKKSVLVQYITECWELWFYEYFILVCAISIETRLNNEQIKIPT